MFKNLIFLYRYIFKLYQLKILNVPTWTQENNGRSSISFMFCYKYVFNWLVVSTSSSKLNPSKLFSFQYSSSLVFMLTIR